MKKVLHKANSIFSAIVPLRYQQVVRYLIAGGTAAATDIILLFVFTSILDIWYLISTVLAFLIAFVVSFLLQKYWTFTDGANAAWKSQAIKYLAITSTNLGLNTLLMYVSVDFLHLHYLLAQIIVSGLIAVESYFIYQIFVFKKKPPVPASIV